MLLVPLLLAHAEPALRLAIETEAGLEPLPWSIPRQDQAEPRAWPDARAPRRPRESPTGFLQPDNHRLVFPNAERQAYQVDVWWVDPDDDVHWSQEVLQLRKGEPSRIPADRAWTVEASSDPLVVDLERIGPIRTPVLVRVQAGDERPLWAGMVQYRVVSTLSILDQSGTTIFATDRRTGGRARNVTVRRGDDEVRTDRNGLARLPVWKGEGRVPIVVDDGKWISIAGYTQPQRPVRASHPGWRMAVDRENLMPGEVVHVAGWVDASPGASVSWELRVNQEVFQGAPVRISPLGAYALTLTIPEAEEAFGNAQLSLIETSPEGRRELARRTLRILRPHQRPIEGLRIEALDLQVPANKPIRFRIHSEHDQPVDVELAATYAPANWPIGAATVHRGPWLDPLPPIDNSQRIRRTVTDGEVITLHVTEVPPYPVWLTLRPTGGAGKGSTASVQVATATHLVGIHRADRNPRVGSGATVRVSVTDVAGHALVGAPVQVSVERLDRLDAAFPHRTPLALGCDTVVTSFGEAICEVHFPEPGPYAIVAESPGIDGRVQRTEIREVVERHPWKIPAPISVDAYRIDVSPVTHPGGASPHEPPHWKTRDWARVPALAHPQSHPLDTVETRVLRPFPRDEISGEPFVLRIDPPLRSVRMWVHTRLNHETIDQRFVIVDEDGSAPHITLPDSAWEGRTAGRVDVTAVTTKWHAPFDTEGWPTVGDKQLIQSRGSWTGVYDPHRTLHVGLRPAADGQIRIGVAADSSKEEPDAELIVALDLGPHHGRGAEPLVEWLDVPAQRLGSSGRSDWPASTAMRAADPLVRDLPFVSTPQGGFGGRGPSHLPAIDRLQPVLLFTGVVPTDLHGEFTLDLPETGGPFRLWVWARTPDGRTGRLDTTVDR